MRYLLALLLFSFLAFSCGKSGGEKQPTPTEPQFDVDNTWQCEVGGKLYKGTIDTSFSYLNSGFEKDTIVTLSGSTADGKANLALRMYINRTAWQSNMVSLGLASNYFTFDTASTNYLVTKQGTVMVPFTIEGFIGTKLKGSFSGSLASITGINQPITNGKVSLEIGKGSRAPKFLEATVAGAKLAGPIRSAVLKANTLIIDGFTFNGDTTYQLQVRTGGTLKPGTYKSTDGDVGFQVYRPSITTHYVSDSVGDLSVTILSVDGPVVTGTFEGKALLGGGSGATAPVTSGRFSCRVSDYQPYADVSNQWKFSMDNFGQPPYLTAGGNITRAEVKQSGSFYVLSLSGNTDNGRSVFSLTLRSFTPFAPKTYALQSFTDSCYLSTPTDKYFNSNSNFYVRIDSLTNTRLVGGFYGSSMRSGTLYGSGLQQTLRKGTFRTNGNF